MTNDIDSFDTELAEAIYSQAALDPISEIRAREFLDDASTIDQIPHKMFLSSSPLNLAGVEVIQQGDGLSNMPFVDLPNQVDEDNAIVKYGCGLILSRTCDIDMDNSEAAFKRIVYVPVVSLEKYIRVMAEEGLILSEGQLDAIKNQRTSIYMYIPKGQNLESDSIALLNRMMSCHNNHVDRKQLEELTTFRLGVTGWYTLLKKINSFFIQPSAEVIQMRLDN